MKISFKWLKDFVDINVPAAEIAQKLTMAGLEVKGVETIGGTWENVVIGQIMGIARHPNADRLNLATVNLGTSQETVVCGAPNLKLGDKIAFARVGAQLIDPHTGQVEVLKPAKIRGVVSTGMVCSEKELGISENHEGILVLPSDAPLGVPLADYIGDAIFNMEVTPNRPDCLNIMGISREIAALTGQNPHIPEVSYIEAASSIDKQVSVEIVAPDLCPRYCASLITGVKIGESPKWMQQRLLACGQRPINNIVDVTNYVMLEYGQPLHSFDYDRIRGKKIIVRRARSGEGMTTLDGTARTLSDSMLVIADVERAVAVAGVMGGANTEVTEGTTSILLEAASFNPASIHYTGRTLNLPSEACVRFERGIRAELALPALKRATQLIIEVAGGEAAKGWIDVFPGKEEPKPISVSTADMKRVLGIEFSPEEVTTSLTLLGFECQPGSSPSEVLALAPYWRSDIHLKEDLVEEVARVIGYDRIPLTMISEPIPRQKPQPMLDLKANVRRGLVGYGFQEIISFSLIGMDMINKLLPEPHPYKPAPLHMQNPMTAELEYLRPSLRPNLLAALGANRRREDDGIRLFELGNIYLPRPKDLPDEREMICGVLNGPRMDKLWHGSEESVDFFEAKGVIEGLLSQLGVTASFELGSDESLRSDEQANILIDGTKAGVFGKLQAKVLESFEITGDTYLFEIDLPALLPLIATHKTYLPVPRFPAVVRDIALVVDAATIHKQIVDIIRGFSLVVQVAIFDVYSGEQVPPGKKSLAYRITYQSPSHTLTDDEVNKVQQQILDRLSRDLGATLRT